MASCGQSDDALASIGFPHRHVSMLGLSVGFLLVWTAVLSGLLVNNTFETNANIGDTVRTFNAHQDIGRIVFAIGHEMVSTVDLLLTEPLNLTEKNFDQVLSITWRMTDAVVDQVEERAPYTWPAGTSVILETVREKLRDYRERNLRKILTPLGAIALYEAMCETFETEFRDVSGFPILNVQPNTQLLPFASNAYPIFNRGMSKRFAELALGTYYFRSQMPMNVSLYFNLHHTSRELITSAFKYNPRVHLRYFEIQILDEQVEDALAMVGQDILHHSANRSSNGHAAKYLDGVKEEIATLLLAKDFLNTTIANEIHQLTRANYTELNFHLCIASIALTAVVLTLILMCCSVRYVNATAAGDSSEKPLPVAALPVPGATNSLTPSPLATLDAMAMVGALDTHAGYERPAFRPTYPVASAGAERNIHFLPTSLYNRPHCYL